MAVTEFPRDTRGLAISVLRPGLTLSHQITITSTTNRNSSAFNSSTKIISIYSTEDLFIEIGTSIITATTSNHFIPKNSYLFFSVMVGQVPFTNIAGIRSTTDGTLYVSEFQ